MGMMSGNTSLKILLVSPSGPGAESGAAFVMALVISRAEMRANWIGSG